MTVQPSAQPAPDAAIPDGTGRGESFLNYAITMYVHRHVRWLVYREVYERYGYTRAPGSVYYDENGEVA